MDTKDEIKKKANETNAVAIDSHSLYGSMDNFEDAQRIAKALCSSTLIPKEYQNNIPNCLIALEISNRAKVSPLMVMQNLYIVHGKPGWSSQYIIAAINHSGKFDLLQFEMSGKEGTDDWGCRAWAMIKGTRERVQGAQVTIRMAKAEAWASRSGSKWKTMPEVMLRYRAASFFGKVYAPEILIGFSTADEIIDIAANKKGNHRVLEAISSLSVDVKEANSESKTATIWDVEGDAESRISKLKVTDVKIVLLENRINIEEMLEKMKIKSMSEVKGKDLGKIKDYLEGA